MDGSAPKSFSVMVIEDNPGDVEIICMALENAGLNCDVTVIEEGAEAILEIRRQAGAIDVKPPDLVVLDLNLPKYDGLEILKAMRQKGSFASVPVAILSSSSSARDRAKIEGLNVSVYITKPSDLDEYLKIGFLLKDLLEPGHQGHPQTH